MMHYGLFQQTLLVNCPVFGEGYSFVDKEIVGLKQLVSRSQAIIEWIEKEIEMKTKHFDLVVESH